MERQEGYYWVKHDGYFRIAEFVAYQGSFGKGWWNLFAENDTFSDEDFEFINENRIKEPGELPD